MVYKLPQSRLVEIHKTLKEWKEKNEISLAMSQKGVVANLMEEITEHRRANTSDDELQMIDAKCDLIVFAMNAIDELPDFNLEPGIYGSLDRDRVAFEACICIELFHYIQFEENKIMFSADHKHKALDKILCEIIARCIDSIDALGFDPDRAMEETIKQITSRSGKMDYNIGKWLKDKSPEAQAREYKADYTSCRVRN